MDGPGSIPSRTMPPRKIAMDPDPGMPNSMVGRSAPPCMALLALSGAITPRTSPLPKLGFFLLVCTAWP